jgi:hypothetical protein
VATMKTQQERANLWLQIAKAFSRTPSGGSERIGLVVFALLACVTLPSGLLILLSNATVGATAEEARNIQWGGYALLGVGMLMVPLTYYQWHFIKRARALRESLLRIARESSGTVVNSMSVAQWLGRFWQGEYPQASLMSHAGIFRVTIESPATSVLIDLTPSGFTTGGSGNPQVHWWANVLVAVDRPFPGGTVIPNQPALQWIESQGYQVQCEAGCLSARGAALLEGTFKKDPASTHEIFKVAVQLASIATTMRAASSRQH